MGLADWIRFIPSQITVIICGLWMDDRAYQSTCSCNAMSRLVMVVIYKDNNNNIGNHACCASQTLTYLAPMKKLGSGMETHLGGNNSTMRNFDAA